MEGVRWETVNSAPSIFLCHRRDYKVKDEVGMPSIDMGKPKASGSRKWSDMSFLG
jgi:hypothetical protein